MALAVTAMLYCIWVNPWTNRWYQSWWLLHNSLPPPYSHHIQANSRLRQIPCSKKPKFLAKSLGGQEFYWSLDLTLDSVNISKKTRYLVLSEAMQVLHLTVNVRDRWPWGPGGAGFRLSFNICEKLVNLSIYNFFTHFGNLHTFSL